MCVAKNKEGSSNALSKVIVAGKLMFFSFLIDLLWSLVKPVVLCYSAVILSGFFSIGVGKRR